MPSDEFQQRGWVRTDHLPGLDTWLSSTEQHAERLIEAEENARWLRAGGTWYAGVNLLNNDPTGACPGGPPIPDSVNTFVNQHANALFSGWDRGQLSVVYPGYPRRDPGESVASFSFRLQRDAAHVDGLHAVGATRRRHAIEQHAFVLGIPWTDAPEGGSALVVWEHSHEIMRERLGAILEHLDVDAWPAADLTERYRAARREVFEHCTRIEVSAPRGGAYLVHRLAVHGISPWRAPATPGARRAVCYFRPELVRPGDWLRR